MEATALATLAEAALAGAWRRESPIHGDEHWRCVTATGLALATETRGVDRTLVFCFGLLHDTRRVNEGIDPDHGSRAASFASELGLEGLLPEAAWQVLAEALILHSKGRVSDEPTVGTCWDADRLHLPRVAIEPDRAFFSTEAARGDAALEAAASLRSVGPPTWDELIASV